MAAERVITVDSVLWVEPSLAEALDMWGQKTTARKLFRYAAENAQLPSFLHNDWERTQADPTIRTN